jgi:hypothetical protein
MRVSIKTRISLLGFLCACQTPQIKHSQARTAPIDSTPLGHLGPGCRYRGAAAYDVLARSGTIVDSAEFKARQGDLVVEIRDIHTQTPLSAIKASLLEQDGRVIPVQDSSGRVLLRSIPNGVHHLTVRRIGYEMLEGPVLIRRGMTDTLFVSLNSDRSVLGDIGC